MAERVAKVRSYPVIFCSLLNGIWLGFFPDRWAPHSLIDWNGHDCAKSSDLIQ
jgi:hypothetical protein